MSSEHDLDTAISAFGDAQEDFCGAEPGLQKTAALARRDQAEARMQEAAAKLRRQGR